MMEDYMILPKLFIPKLAFSNILLLVLILKKFFIIT